MAIILPAQKKTFIVLNLPFSDLKWDISLFSDIPFYQYYNGYQLGIHGAAVMVSKKYSQKRFHLMEQK